MILAYAKRLRFTNYLVRLGGNLAQLSIGGGEIGIAIWQHMFLNFGEHFVKFRFDEHKKLLIERHEFEILCGIRKPIDVNMFSFSGCPCAVTPKLHLYFKITSKLGQLSQKLKDEDTLSQTESTEATINNKTFSIIDQNYEFYDPIFETEFKQFLDCVVFSNNANECSKDKISVISNENPTIENFTSLSLFVIAYL